MLRAAITAGQTLAKACREAASAIQAVRSPAAGLLRGAQTPSMPAAPRVESHVDPTSLPVQRQLESAWSPARLPSPPVLPRRDPAQLQATLTPPRQASPLVPLQAQRTSSVAVVGNHTVTAAKALSSPPSPAVKRPSTESPFPVRAKVLAAASSLPAAASSPMPNATSGALPAPVHVAVRRASSYPTLCAEISKSKASDSSPGHRAHERERFIGCTGCARKFRDKANYMRHLCAATVPARARVPAIMHSLEHYLCVWPVVTVHTYTHIFVHA